MATVKVRVWTEDSYHGFSSGCETEGADRDDIRKVLLDSAEAQVDYVLDEIYGT